MKAIIMNSVLYFAYELLESLFSLYEQGLNCDAKITDTVAGVISG